ncbi:accessory gene regulator B family protein [Marinicrinis lubricantis]|uniref:Accessory gene regulator B family protein n=1 Tax=Marinicrinis lubricantis TaxID=2086470 RepID=A0ABW1IT32_9BACL
MIKAFSYRLAVSLKSFSGVHEASVQVLQYALINMINIVSIIIIISIVSGILGTFPETMLALILFIIIRFLSGGSHLKQAESCIIVSSAILSIVPFVPVSAAVIWPIGFISLLLHILYAPQKLKWRKIPERHLIYFKISSCIFILSGLVVESDVFALVCLIQSVTLLPKLNEE